MWLKKKKVFVYDGWWGTSLAVELGRPLEVVIFELRPCGCKRAGLGGKKEEPELQEKGPASVKEQSRKGAGEGAPSLWDL